MQIPDLIAAHADELTAIRRDLHAHPEIGFEERRTSAIVAEKLAGWGVEVHRGLGVTGVVGVLRSGRKGRTVGLRADMDALPMEEQTNLPYRSTNPGAFHGCGHDGHTAMLLGAARYLAETKAFDGDVVFIFQPAEEGLGGARAMIADGLFEKFPCDEIYALHNSPYDPPNRVGVKPGVAMAGADFFDIRIVGRGSHGAMPQMARDPVIAATQLVQSLQTVVSRNADPRQSAVLSVTKIHSGSAYNVIPGEAALGGGVRFFSNAVRDLVRERMTSLAKSLEPAYGVEVEVDIRAVFEVLENDQALSRAFLDVAAGVMGAENVVEKEDAVMGSEDFADMLRIVPGAYFTVGHKGDVPLHNPAFVLDDDVLPVGATLLARIAEARLAAG